MTPGTMLFDENFQFEDGTTGRKILFVLNDGTNGHYFFVKCTSKGNRYTNDFGCQIEHKFPFFFLPQNTCEFLSRNTWIQLDKIHYRKSEELMQAVMTNCINRMGVLTMELAMNLISCASNAPHTEGIISKILLKTHEKLSSSIE